MKKLFSTRIFILSGNFSTSKSERTNISRIFVSYIFRIFLLFFIFINISKSEIIFKPYLQAVGGDSLCLIVASTIPDTVFVQYQIEPNNFVTASTAFYKTFEEKRTIYYIHRIFLTHLKEGTEYSYLLHQASDIYNGSFKTFPAKGKHIKFGVIADTQANPDIHSEIAIKMLNQHPNLVVYAGDLCENGLFSSWESDFFTKPVQTLISQIPFVDALGNHESMSDLYKYFIQPPPGHDKFYYSFDCGDVHFLILNTQLTLSKNSPQYKFAKADLSLNKSHWKVVVMHKPVYSPNRLIQNREYMYLSDSVFVPNRVDFVISGHVHLYQRNILKGIEHLILGGGGAPLKTPKEANYTIKSLQEFHFATFDFEGYSIFVRVFNTKGEVIDSFEVIQQY